MWPLINVNKFQCKVTQCFRVCVHAVIIFSQENLLESFTSWPLGSRRCSVGGKSSDSMCKAGSNKTEKVGLIQKNER